MTDGAVVTPLVIDFDGLIGSASGIGNITRALRCGPSALSIPSLMHRLRSADR